MCLRFSLKFVVFNLLFVQLLASKMDDQLQSLQRLKELSEKLVSSSNNQEFAQEVHSVTERMQAALPTVRDRSDRLPTMLQCFEHQQCIQKHVTFLEEVKSRLEVEFCLDGVVDAENELEVIKVRSDFRLSFPLRLQKGESHLAIMAAIVT